VTYSLTTLYNVLLRYRSFEGSSWVLVATVLLLEFGFWNLGFMALQRSLADLGISVKFRRFPFRFSFVDRVMYQPLIIINRHCLYVLSITDTRRQRVILDEDLRNRFKCSLFFNIHALMT